MKWKLWNSFYFVYLLFMFSSIANEHNERYGMTFVREYHSTGRRTHKLSRKLSVDASSGNGHRHWSWHFVFDYVARRCCRLCLWCFVTKMQWSQWNWVERPWKPVPMRYYYARFVILTAPSRQSAALVGQSPASAHYRTEQTNAEYVEII